MLYGEARCYGSKTATGKPVGICIACDRRYSTAPLLVDPAAKIGPDGEWQCYQRRSSGYVESECDLPGEE